MTLAADIVAGVARRLAEHAGLELPAWVVEARASARMAMLELSPAEYVALIGTPRGGAELAALVEAVRVGETRLFRHRSQIAALVDSIVPQLRARSRGKRPIRAWSAGCAAGEEPYTLAAVLSAALPGSPISILATDISSDALVAAARGTYPASALDDLPDEWTTGFAIEGERAFVRPELAELVRFERDNLVESRTKESEAFDIVWCRNVLIYFTQAARRRVIDRLVRATVPGGYVFVGYSESLRDIPELEAVRAGDAVYYTRRDPNEPRPSRPPTPALGVPLVPSTRDSGTWDTKTPPPTRIPIAPPTDDVVNVRGQSTAREITAELTSRLGIEGLQKLVVDLDAADQLADELAPVLRRARAVATAAGIELVVRATRTGARRWLARHGLDVDTAPEDAP